MGEKIPEAGEIWINKLDREKATIISAGTQTVTYSFNIENTTRDGIFTRLDNFLELYELHDLFKIASLEAALKKMRRIF